MNFTLATLEDQMGEIMPSDDAVKNYLETLPKDRINSIAQKMPNHIRKEFCGVSNINDNTLKQELPAIGVGGVVGGSVGYYIGGIGGAIVGGLIGGLSGYYAKQKGIV